MQELKSDNTTVPGGVLAVVIVYERPFSDKLTWTAQIKD